MSGGLCPRLAADFARATTTVDKTARSAILNHMVKFSDIALDRTFAALADPTRRALVMRLADEARSFGERACRAVCDVAAGGDEASRRIVRCRARLARQDRARRRLPARRRADAGRLRMAQPLRKILVRAAVQPRRVPGRRRVASQKEKSWPPKPPSNQASPSSAASKRRPPKSSPRGQSRKR